MTLVCTFMCERGVLKQYFTTSPTSLGSLIQTQFNSLYKAGLMVIFGSEDLGWLPEYTSGSDRERLPS